MSRLAAVRWGTYVAIAVILVGLVGLQRNAMLNKGFRGALVETAKTVAVILLICGSIVLLRALLI